MCGRYASSSRPEDLVEQFEVDEDRMGQVVRSILVTPQSPPPGQPDFGPGHLTTGDGEVQSPLRVHAAERTPRVGDPIVFRHAKAGELAERFAEYLLLEGGAISSREPTYRGEGRTFL